MIFIFSEDDLRDLYPTSTSAERRRFFRSFYSSDRDGKVSNKNMTKDNMLGKYLEFRDIYKLDAPDNVLAKAAGNDKADWDYASTLALKMAVEQKDNNHSKSRKRNAGFMRRRRQQLRDESLNSASTESTDITSSASSDQNSIVPQFMYASKISPEESIHLTGSPDRALMLQIIPSKMNFRTMSYETHILLVSLYLDRKFDRTNEDKAVVAIDFYHNQQQQDNKKRSSSIIPTIRSMMERVHCLYPDRFQDLIVYPSPEQRKNSALRVGAKIKGLLQSPSPSPPSSKITNYWEQGQPTASSRSTAGGGLLSKRWLQAKPRMIKVVYSGDGIEMSLSELQ